MRNDALLLYRCNPPLQQNDQCPQLYFNKVCTHKERIHRTQRVQLALQWKRLIDKTEGEYELLCLTGCSTWRHTWVLMGPDSNKMLKGWNAYNSTGLTVNLFNSYLDCMIKLIKLNVIRHESNTLLHAFWSPETKYQMIYQVTI